MRTKRVTEYRAILVYLHPAQVKALEGIKEATGQTRTELIRFAVSEMIGRHTMPRGSSADGR